MDTRHTLSDDRVAFGHGLLTSRKTLDGLDQLGKVAGREFGSFLHEVLNTSVHPGDHQENIAAHDAARQAGSIGRAPPTRWRRGSASEIA